MMRALFLAILFLSIPLASLIADDGWAVTAESDLRELRLQLEGFEKTGMDLLALDGFQQRLNEMRTSATSCIEQTGRRITQLDERIAVLGDILEGESAVVRDQRAVFARERSDANAQLAKCRLLLLEAESLTAGIQRLRQSLISERLSTRALSLWSAILALPDENLRASLLPRQLRHLDSFGWVWGFVFALLALMPISLVGAHQLRDYARNKAEKNPSSARLAGMYGRRLPWVLLVISIARAMFWLGMQAYPVVLLALALAMLTTPLLDGLFGLTSYTRGLNTLPARALWTVALLSIAAYSLEGYRADEFSAVITILRSLILTALFTSTAWMLMTLIKGGGIFGVRGLQWPLLALLLIGPLAFVLGYHNLGAYLVRGVYGSILVGFFGWLGYLFLLLLLGQFPYAKKAQPDAEAIAAQPSSLLSAAVERDKHRYSIGRRLALYGVWLIAGILALRIWSFTPGEPLHLLQPLTLSYEFGAITIVPSKWLSGVVLFMLFWIFARALTSSIGRYWQVKDSASRGARQSVLTLTSYAIIAIGIFFGVSAAGLELSNLAIIAGALSVGIGFGMQTIVNNFVSGLILLFERPIRPGDWVVVGQTEGYVRQIRIRSTLIETFDRSEVLVPNSDMLNNHLINRTFSDGLGRINVPIGVAYGSDKQLVRDLLLKAAKDHPLILSNDPRVPTPRVLFLRFGDNALEFELRCYIQEIDYRMSIVSDLLYAIDDAFREHNIEIPFPQRVVHSYTQPASQET